MPQETERTIRLELQDEVAVCLAFFEIFPLTLHHRLGVSDEDFAIAYIDSLSVMTSMVLDNPRLFRETVFAAMKRLARTRNEFGRHGVSIEEAIAAFKGDGSCPDGIDPENWQSSVK